MRWNVYLILPVRFACAVNLFWYCLCSERFFVLLIPVRLFACAWEARWRGEFCLCDDIDLKLLAWFAPWSYADVCLLNSSCVKIFFPVNALEASRRVKFFVLAGAREIWWRGKIATVIYAWVVLLYLHRLRCLLEKWNSVVDVCETCLWANWLACEVRV